MLKNNRLPSRIRFAAAACAVIAPMFSVAAFAQPPAEPFDSARHRSGLVAINPSVAVIDAGVDTNVFNTFADPRSDFVLTFRPAADVWMRAGAIRVEASARADMNYFRDSSSERSINTDDSVRVDVRGTKLRPFATAAYLNSRDRSSPEIDTRIRHTDWSAGLGTDLAFSERLGARVQAGQFVTRYADAGVPSGFSQSLDRTERNASVAVRYRLTPLTTVAMESAWQSNRFAFQTSRDADALTLRPGVEFALSALITGSSYIGYRRFDFQDPAVPDFSGIVAAVDLSYALRGTTRIGVTARRDVDYSFQILEPYYVASGYGVRLDQQVTERIGLRAAASRQTLDYVQLAITNVTPRVDYVTFLSGGVVSRLGAKSRVELMVTYRQRSSQRFTRAYDSLVAGGSVFYEF